MRRCCFPPCLGPWAEFCNHFTWSLPFPGGTILALSCNVLKSVINASLSLGAPQLFGLQGDLFKGHKLPGLWYIIYDMASDDISYICTEKKWQTATGSNEPCSCGWLGIFLNKHGYFSLSITGPQQTKGPLLTKSTHQAAVQILSLLLVSHPGALEQKSTRE